MKTSSSPQNNRRGSRTYTLQFSNSRTGQKTLLHPDATYRFVETQLNEYQDNWKSLKERGEIVRRTRTGVTFQRIDTLTGEPYVLKVWFIENKKGHGVEKS